MDDLARSDGVVIRAWRCPVSWHRYVKWREGDAYCIEPCCEHSSLDTSVTSESRRADMVPAPRSVVTITRPGESDERGRRQ